ncbi:hypothetical protein GOODEAATRI_028915 [Goodea atripinnis]|uniref:RAB6-interacting golgin n=1 Tax=Goodea atripinnis TaxID=208336 RepID=A0ABV0P8P2_9TELE
MSGWAGFSEEELRRIQQKASRSRQKIQRERALQLAGSQSLLPGQQLSKPPPILEGQPPDQTEAPAAGQDKQQKRVDMKPNDNHHPAAEKEEEKIPVVKELEKQEVELSKQTQAEAVKLKRIQKELQALDDMVSNDISILRGRIEQASWDYSAARLESNNTRTFPVMHSLTEKL